MVHGFLYHNLLYLWGVVSISEYLIPFVLSTLSMLLVLLFLFWILLIYPRGHLMHYTELCQ